MQPPKAGWLFRRLDVEFSAAFIYSEKCERIEVGAFAVAVAGYLDQFHVQQFLAGLVESVARFPTALFHDRPCHAQIAVVETLELRQQIIQQLDGVGRQTDVNLAFQQAVRQSGKPARFAAFRGEPVFLFLSHAPLGRCLLLCLRRAGAAPACIEPGVHVLPEIENPAPFDELRPVAVAAHHGQRFFGKSGVCGCVFGVHPPIGEQRHFFVLDKIIHCATFICV